VEPLFDGGCGRQGPTRQPISRATSKKSRSYACSGERRTRSSSRCASFADEDAPAVGLDLAEDDGRGLRRAGRIAQARARIAFAPITFYC
jgi:hypothetical protein